VSAASDSVGAAGCGPALLGVERSLSGRRWQSSPGDVRLAQAISQRFGLPELVGRVIAARGVALDDVDSFLNPTLRQLLPDPSHLLGMPAATERLVGAITQGQTVGIFGDYDVDGATAAALLLRFFAAVGATATVHIPDRLAEGYGPNLPALLRMQAAGAAVVITVDCGIAAFEALDGAAAAGLDVIVVDHHQGEAALPRAVAVIDPNRLDETSRHGQLAAVGVTFLLVVALNRRLREVGWYAGRQAPDPMQWLDIVALGTVCDMVPLVGVNRALVAQGLKVMAQRGNPGIAALADAGGVKERLEAYHAAYVLGPRVNAGGRIGQADLGVRLLSTGDPLEAQHLVQILDGHNRDRQEIEAAVLLDAIEQVEGRPSDDLPLVMAVGEGWHPGVIGIIAGRLKERYNRPACVIALDGDEGKGSGRSVAGLDLGAAVIAARQAGLLVKGGGHAMAAGFTVARDRLAEFRAFVGERLAAQLAGPLQPVLQVDGVLDTQGATLALVETLRRLGPFGSGNPEPRFAVMAARIVAPRVVGMGHVACVVSGPAGGRIKGIAFRSADCELGQALLSNVGMPLHLAGTLRIDSWQGSSNVQMFIEDASPLN
jgi:single-stranded-DNA-specific exonuclease